MQPWGPTMPDRGLRDGARTRAAALGLLVAMAGGCGGGGDGPAAAGGEDTAGADAPLEAGEELGAGCTKNADCAAGLFCMQSEFAPAGWCTALCDNPGDHCAGPELGGVAALCVQMPGEFRGPDKPFCARTCDNTLQCTQVWASWEVCAKPAYKNTPLYNDLPTRVCMAPGSHGRLQIDPLLCDWRDKVTQTRYQAPKQLCKAYCTYLRSCKLFDAKKENIDCCSWRCFQKMTPSGAVDDTLEDALKCYTTAFYQAYANTPEVCSGPVKDCGEPDVMARR